MKLKPDTANVAENLGLARSWAQREKLVLLTQHGILQYTCRPQYPSGLSREASFPVDGD